MITSAQKLLMARAGVKSPVAPFTLLGTSTFTGDPNITNISLPSGAEEGATWVLAFRGGNGTMTFPSGFQDLGQLSASSGFFVSAKTLTLADITQGSFAFTSSVSGTNRVATAVYASCSVSAFTSPVNTSDTTTSSIVPTADGLGLVAFDSSGSADPTFTPTLEPRDVGNSGVKLFSDTVSNGVTFGPYTFPSGRARVRHVLILLE